MNNPLLPDEIPAGMIAYLDQQRSTRLPNGKTQSQVLIECVQCHDQRWVVIANIRNGHTKTSICRACYLQKGNASELEPQEISALKDVILYFDQQLLVQETKGRQQQMMRILAECPDCHKQRWIRVNSFRNGRTKSTVCNGCSRKRQPHPLLKKGMQITNGYRELHIRILSDEDQELAKQHFTFRGRRRYIYEHRFVALKAYGPRALLPGIVVRHIDGNKLNNDPSNLILGTQSDNARDHVEAIAEMEAWRALALFLLTRLAE